MQRVAIGVTVLALGAALFLSRPDHGTRGTDYYKLEYETGESIVLRQFNVGDGLLSGFLQVAPLLHTLVEYSPPAPSGLCTNNVPDNICSPGAEFDPSDRNYHVVPACRNAALADFIGVCRFSNGELLDACLTRSMLNSSFCVAQCTTAVLSALPQRANLTTNRFFSANVTGLTLQPGTTTLVLGLENTTPGSCTHDLTLVSANHLFALMPPLRLQRNASACEFSVHVALTIQAELTVTSLQFVGKAGAEWVLTSVARSTCPTSHRTTLVALDDSNACVNAAATLLRSDTLTCVNATGGPCLRALESYTTDDPFVVVDVISLNLPQDVPQWFQLVADGLYTSAVFNSSSSFYDQTPFRQLSILGPPAFAVVVNIWALPDSDCLMGIAPITGQVWSTQFPLKQQTVLASAIPTDGSRLRFTDAFVLSVTPDPLVTAAGGACEISFSATTANTSLPVYVGLDNGDAGAIDGAYGTRPVIFNVTAGALITSLPLRLGRTGYHPYEPPTTIRFTGIRCIQGVSWQVLRDPTETVYRHPLSVTLGGASTLNFAATLSTLRLARPTPTMEALARALYRSLDSYPSDAPSAPADCTTLSDNLCFVPRLGTNFYDELVTAVTLPNNTQSSGRRVVVTVQSQLDPCRHESVISIGASATVDLPDSVLTAYEDSVFGDFLRTSFMDPRVAARTFRTSPTASRARNSICLSSLVTGETAQTIVDSSASVGLYALYFMPFFGPRTIFSSYAACISPAFPTGFYNESRSELPPVTLTYSFALPGTPITLPYPYDSAGLFAAAPAETAACAAAAPTGVSWSPPSAGNVTSAGPDGCPVTLPLPVASTAAPSADTRCSSWY